MDELSWRARLAKSNINILWVDNGTAAIEFTYHPKPGVFKWCKTIVEFDGSGLTDQDAMAGHILDEVLSLRKELEG